MSIEVEIDNRKLYFTGRILNINSGAPCRRVFLIRLIRWKWNFSKKITGFIQDIVKILQKYGHMHYLTEFVLTNCYPNKNRWRKIVNERLQKCYQLVWKDKIIRNKQLYVYAKVHPINEVSHSWPLGKDDPRYLNEITDDFVDHIRSEDCVCYTLTPKGYTVCLLFCTDLNSLRSSRSVFKNIGFDISRGGSRILRKGDAKFFYQFISTM